MADGLSGDHPFAACANCGDAFEFDVSYPVETRGGGDRELELYSFCDETCKRAWESGNQPSSEPSSFVDAGR